MTRRAEAPIDDSPLRKRDAARWHLAATLLLVAAVVATAVLAADAVLLLHPPGCGEDSGCARAARSAWATIPGVGWPVSVLAFAYFLAVGAAWWPRPRAGRAFVRVVRGGAVVSLVYLGALVAERILCPWCLAVHAANLAFLAAFELGHRGRVPGRTPLPRMGVVFVTVATALLAVRAFVMRGRIEADLPPPAALTVTYAGRHHEGPEVAPLRIVVYSDYQCPDCRRIERAIREVLESRDDVVVSSRHFPMCADCNRYLKGKTLHANACWAARAAEAAGILHGPTGYRRLHRWLFDRGGAFTDAEIVRAVRGFGWDVPEFLAVMQSERTLELVREDIDEAKALGVFFTPLVFVNGVELKWRSGRALEELVETVAAMDPPPRRFDEDPLPLAAGKIVTDWAEGEIRELPPEADRAPSLGPTDAPVLIVVWGDLQEEGTATLHAWLLDRIERRADVRYRFLHYPLQADCNPAVTTTRHPQACLAARAAEAAARQGGPESFWRMLDRLLERRGAVDRAFVGATAEDLGLERVRLLGDLDSPEVADAIARQVRAARRLDVRFVPMVWINGRRAERWRTGEGGNDVLTLLLDAAARETRAGSGPGS